MPAHVHAALIAQFAEDAQKIDKPWRLWQCLTPRTSTWFDLDDFPKWNPENTYRRKPGSLNGHEYPLAETEPPEFGAHYWMPDPLHVETILGQLIWTGDEYDVLRLHRGLVHLSEEAALAHALAIILAGNGER